MCIPVVDLQKISNLIKCKYQKKVTSERRNTMDTMFVNSKQQQKQTERACEKRAIGMSIMNTWVTMTNSVKYG